MEAWRQTILLKGGTLLVHDSEDHIVPRRADLLIQDDRIGLIEPQIPASSSMKVIDCTRDIISPGFIDTHHHAWQSQQKGLHCDHTLLDYYHSGNLASYHLSLDDVFWGQLSGALEAVDAGTTTIVDHAHLNYSPEHSVEAIRATVASGIRSTFCYCAHPRVATWQPQFTMENEIFPKWVMATFAQLASKQPFGPNGRVRLGFAIDSAYLAPQLLGVILSDVRAKGVKLITSHATRVGNRPSHTASAMAKKGLLGPDILLSHANFTTKEELNHMKNTGAHISSTPHTELHMGHGHPICLEPEFFDISSLGVDCHSVCSSFLPAQMLLVLQASRARRHEELLARGQLDASVGPTVEDVFNLGTIKGARAVGLENEVGSLAVGKKADMVIFDGTTPSMRAVAERHPVSGIVLHSSIRDIKTVIIDGIIRKETSKLSPVLIQKGIDIHTGAEQDEHWLDWESVGRELDRSWKALQTKMEETVDEKLAKDGIMRSLSEIVRKIAEKQ
ncbi:amidohydrolase family protein [Zopfia rhizophila CBS 207.26]|uniref:Amidohydrolase family protein n=1 Tax=Zopfia rhizophila CBS 207.26 TaxID=1314779 RepID=A0A6A6ER34_9PEZI|nr:amidohydrolase family protein [Zopfia rhizophila CBS 207.26]